MLSETDEKKTGRMPFRSSAGSTSITMTREKTEVINIYKGTVKKKTSRLLQLFTSDWVVRYMVDNSLGRYWIERHPESKLAEKLEFFVTPKNGEIKHIDEFVKPEDVSSSTPAWAAAVILVYL